MDAHRSDFMSKTHTQHAHSLYHEYIMIMSCSPFFDHSQTNYFVYAVPRYNIIEITYLNKLKKLD